MSNDKTPMFVDVRPSAKTPMFVDVRPSARTLGVGEKWLRAEIKAGRVPGIQIGNRFKVNLSLYIDQLNSKGVIR